jgi:hypothetical protein
MSTKYPTFRAFCPLSLVLPRIPPSRTYFIGVIFHALLIHPAFAYFSASRHASERPGIIRQICRAFRFVNPATYDSHFVIHASSDNFVATRSSYDKNFVNQMSYDKNFANRPSYDKNFALLYKTPCENAGRGHFDVMGF